MPGGEISKLVKIRPGKQKTCPMAEMPRSDWGFKIPHSGRPILQHSTQFKAHFQLFIRFFSGFPLHIHAHSPDFGWVLPKVKLVGVPVK